MHTFVRPYTAGLAAASAGVLTLSLVTAPPDTDVTVARTEAHVMQLATITEADIRTAIVNTTASVLTPATTPSPAAAATPQANASAPNPEEVLTDAAFLALVVALTPVWYVGFPVTLPFSIAFIWIITALGGGPPPDLPTTLVVGTAMFALFPLSYVYSAVSSLLSALNLPQLSLAAATSATPGTASAVAAESASRSVSALARGNASATSTASHPARKHGNEAVGDEAIGPLTQASEVTPRPVADEAAAAKPARPATGLGDTAALPARPVSQSKPGKETATNAAAAHSTGSSKNAKAVSTGKPAKKPAAHSPAAKTTGKNNAGPKTKSDH